MPSKDRAPIHLSFKDRVRYALPTLAKVGNALTAAVIAGSIALHHRNISSVAPSEIPTPIPIVRSGGTEPPLLTTFPELPLSKEAKEAIIQQEINRLEIKPSQHEQGLWRKGYRMSSTKLALSESMRTEGNRRVFQTLDLMEQSENPYFQDAIKFLQVLNKTDDLTISVHNIPLGQTAARGDIEIVDGKIHYTLRLSLDYLLNHSSSITLAFVLTHETEHLRNYQKFIDALPHLSIEEKYQRAKAREKDPSEYLEEEKRGYGISTLAFIYAKGLTQYPASGDIVDDAVNFIKCQRDIQSECWGRYVRRYFD